MNFAEAFENCDSILMEGALGERLKREYGMTPDPDADLAVMVRDPRGRQALRALWTQYAGIAAEHGLCFVAATPTRRANRERMERAGLDGSLIRENVLFLQEVLAECSKDRPVDGVRMFAGGLMGSRGDAYTGEGALPEKEALEFHRWQARLFQESGVDYLMAGLMPTLPEAKGMAQAMAETGIPYLISLTVQKDGRMPDTTAIADAVTAIDAAAGTPPVCYMTNCVHPDILYEALLQPFNRTETVERRFLGIQANTSPLSFDLLDASGELLTSEPGQLAESMLRLRDISHIKLFGGCCGTDAAHMEKIAERIGEGKHRFVKNR